LTAEPSLQPRIPPPPRSHPLPYPTPNPQLMHLLLDAGSELLNGTARLALDKRRLELWMRGAGWEQEKRRRQAEAAGPGRPTRGVLTVAGGRDQLANALISVRVLRHHLKCDYPVEVGRPFGGSRGGAPPM
jgi:hypothetical protein